MDYIIEPYFNKLFSTREELVISFDNQVLLSQKELNENNDQAKN